MRGAGAFAVIVAASVLSGCGAMLEPETRNVKPPVATKAPGAPVGGGVVPAVARVEAPAERSHVVVRGDTLYSVARRYSTTPAMLATLNDLQPPFAIQAGQALRLPPIRTMRATTQADAAPILVAANVRPQVANGSLASGSIVGRMPVAAKDNGAPAPVAAPRAGVQQVALAPPPAAVPDLKPVELPPPEAKPAALKLPDPKPAEVKAPETKLAAVPGLPAPSASPGGPTPEQIAAVVAPPSPAEVKPAQPTPTLGTAVPPPPPRSATGFILPVQGRIISAFGPQAGGLSNDGINIAAPKGTPVVAAEHGTVVYAGNELRGFGNMLLVRHADGWLTAYAHLDQMVVTRGARVTRGQHIGNVGMTGNVTSPQLHFEVRQGKQPVDPEKQLGGGSTPTAASRAGTTQVGALPQ